METGKQAVVALGHLCPGDFTAAALGAASQTSCPIKCMVSFHPLKITFKRRNHPASARGFPHQRNASLRARTPHSAVRNLLHSPSFADKLVDVYSTG